MRPEKLAARHVRPAARLAPACAAALSLALASPSDAQTVPPPEQPAAVPSCAGGMVALAGGTYRMGERTAAGSAVVDRLAKVTVQPFCLDATEVTVAAYQACVAGGQCTADHPRQSTADGVMFTDDADCNYGAPGKGSHPMNCVDWVQSTTYCQAQGKRLPTEEEWEWAARGGLEGRAYPWGDDAPSKNLCWSGVAARGGTCPVGSYPAGDAPGGIHDLAGNVWEWTSTSHEGGDAGAPRGRLDQRRRLVVARRASRPERAGLPDRPARFPLRALTRVDPAPQGSAIARMLATPTLSARSSAARLRCRSAPSYWAPRAGRGARRR